MYQQDKPLKTLIEKEMAQQGKERGWTTTERPPEPIVPKGLRDSVRDDLLRVNPTELARQLAIIDYGMFKKANYKEFLGQVRNSLVYFRLP